MPASGSGLHLPAPHRPRKALITPQVTEFLPFMWEAWTEFLAARFGSILVIKAWGEWTSIEKLSQEGRRTSIEKLSRGGRRRVGRRKEERKAGKAEKAGRQEGRNEGKKEGRGGSTFSYPIAFLYFSLPSFSMWFSGSGKHCSALCFFDIIFSFYT